MVTALGLKNAGEMVGNGGKLLEKLAENVFELCKMAKIVDKIGTIVMNGEKCCDFSLGET